MDEMQILPPLFDSYELEELLEIKPTALSCEYFTKEGKNQLYYRCVGLSQEKPNGVNKNLLIRITALMKCTAELNLVHEPKSLSNVTIKHLKNGRFCDISSFPVSLSFIENEDIILELHWEPKEKCTSAKYASILTILQKTPVEKTVLNCKVVKFSRNFLQRRPKAYYNPFERLQAPSPGFTALDRGAGEITEDL